MAERLFTVAEVNALVPTLEHLVERLQRSARALREGISALAEATGEAADDLTVSRIVELRPELGPVIAEIDAALSAIRRCGGELKGLDLGLVDFPAEIDGEVVYLCWQYGEKEVLYYHGLDAGFAGRKPLRPGAPPPRYLH